jgi:3-oxoacyl-[acyl-carrier protein] reductase
MISLKNKTIFITGATSGIGLETAKLVLTEGANVAIYSISIPPDSLDIAAFKKNSRALLIKGDICDQKAVRSAIFETVKKFGSIDVLINNAAIAQRKDFIDTSPKDWDDLIDVNIKGTLNVTRQALERMLEQKSGMIINISSGAAFNGIGHLSLYSLTKAAVMNFSQSLSEEVKAKGIDVLTVAPGSTDTEMFRQAFPEHKPHHTPRQVAEIIIKAAKKEIQPDDKLVIDVFYHTQ